MKLFNPYFSETLFFNPSKILILLLTGKRLSILVKSLSILSAIIFKLQVLLQEEEPLILITDPGCTFTEGSGLITSFLILPIIII